jgi:hypothetical protein
MYLFPGVPSEISTQIISNLPPREKLAIRGTSRLGREFIPKEVLPQLRLESLLHIVKENANIEEGFWAFTDYMRLKYNGIPNVNQYIESMNLLNFKQGFYIVATFYRLSTNLLKIVISQDINSLALPIEMIPTILLGQNKYNQALLYKFYINMKSYDPLSIYSDNKQLYKYHSTLNYKAIIDILIYYYNEGLTSKNYQNMIHALYKSFRSLNIPPINLFNPNIDQILDYVEDIVTGKITPGEFNPSLGIFHGPIPYIPTPTPIPTPTHTQYIRSTHNPSMLLGADFDGDEPFLFNESLGALSTTPLISSSNIFPRTENESELFLEEVD